MKAHIDKTRSQLGELSGLQAKTEQAERRILESAQTRLGEVQALIDRAAPGVEGAPESEQQRYTELIAERGQLHQVIANAKQALGE